MRGRQSAREKDRINMASSKNRAAGKDAKTPAKGPARSGRSPKAAPPVPKGEELIAVFKHLVEHQSFAARGNIAAQLVSNPPAPVHTSRQLVVSIIDVGKDGSFNAQLVAGDLLG